MNTSYKRFSLDLHKQDSQEYVHVRKGDTAMGLSVLLVESGTPYSIADGTTAVLAARQPGAVVTYKYESCVIEDNRITVTLPSTITSLAGVWPACLRLTGGGAAIVSPAFTICVEEPAAPEQI